MKFDKPHWSALDNNNGAQDSKLEELTSKITRTIACLKSWYVIHNLPPPTVPERHIRRLNDQTRDLLQEWGAISTANLQSK